VELTALLRLTPSPSAAAVPTGAAQAVPASATHL